MISRREFLRGSATTLLLIPVAAMNNGCGSSSNPGGCDGITSVSTNVFSHVHAICVPTSDLTSPPAAGRTYTSTNSGGHTHTVTLDQSQLQAIQGGGSVTATSSDVTGHTHDFTVVKS